MNKLIRDITPRHQMKLKSSQLVTKGGLIEGRTRLGKFSLARLITRKGGRGAKT